ncbi:hypothetical protein DXB27_20675 [Parabacteroides gordonii]|nr:hypothetical protein DXB27_20675 [Parabacteroides gordonii]
MYRLSYSIDKKEDRKENNFIDFFGGLETISNFADELKRSFFLVTPFFSSTFCFIYLQCDYIRLVPIFSLVSIHI